MVAHAEEIVAAVSRSENVFAIEGAQLIPERVGLVFVDRLSGVSIAVSNAGHGGEQRNGTALQVDRQDLRIESGGKGDKVMRKKNKIYGSLRRCRSCLPGTAAATNPLSRFGNAAKDSKREKHFVLQNP